MSRKWDDVPDEFKTCGCSDWEDRYATDTLFYARNGAHWASRHPGLSRKDFVPKVVAQMYRSTQGNA